MLMSVGETLQQRWYEDRPPLAWTLPLAALYGAVTAARRALYRRGFLHARRLPVPVIVVGNITVGGTGKTPLVIALIDALRNAGLRPGVVSRGYGGSARGPLLLSHAPDPALVGDEPALIRLRSGAPVAIGVDRTGAARLLVDAGANVIVADDGLQHYALARDVEICVVDGVRRFGNGRLLPAGPLREPRARLAAIDFAVCNGGQPRAGEVPMRLAAGDAVPLAGASGVEPLAAFAGRRVHAVAGIGRPARFFDELRTRGIDPVEHPFTDHHRYTAQELAFGDGLPVLMTEKDAVKCRAFARAQWWSVPVVAELPQEFRDELVRRVKRITAPAVHAR